MNISLIIIFVILALVGTAVLWLMTPLSDREKKHLAGKAMKKTSNLKRFMNDAYVAVEKARMTEDVYDYLTSYMEELIRLLRKIQNDEELNHICNYIDRVKECDAALEKEYNEIVKWMAAEEKYYFDFNPAVTRIKDAGDLLLLTAIDVRAYLKTKTEYD